MMDNDKIKKDAFSLKKLEEMKKNNEKILQRHLDVQNDRIAAERNNASITNLNKRKQTVKEEQQRCRNKEIGYTREWDRGKEIDLWKFDNDRAIKDSSHWYKTRTKNWKGQDHRESENRPKPQTFKTNRRSRFNSTHESISTEESYDKDQHIKRSNVEKFWKKDSEDANKKERTITWVKSQRKSNSKHESPKKKYYEFDNEKCQFQKQEICEEKSVYGKKEPLKGYSKFDRYNKSEKSSTSETSENIDVVKEPACVKEKSKKYKVKNVSQSDDGGWSTVEEGEIISDSE